MEIIRTVDAMRAHVSSIRKSGETVALVPTMGFLHEGHLSLMRQAGKLADHVIISIFVNPTQFGPGEDLDAYPRDLDRDVELAASVGVEAVFFPEPSEMYPEGFHTYVNVEELTTGLCGASRPTHFRGVTTVVLKLFNIVQPDYAVFGEKDYQQLKVLERMVRDLNVPVTIVPGALVREADGLAMSSRNKYLSSEQRANALVLSETLTHLQELVRRGQTDVAALKDAAAERISATPGAELDYVEIVDGEELTPLGTVDRPARLALAVRFGTTRLIDNADLGR